MSQVMATFPESQASNASLNRNLYIPTAKKHRKKQREEGWREGGWKASST